MTNTPDRQALASGRPTLTPAELNPEPHGAADAQLHHLTAEILCLHPSGFLRAVASSVGELNDIDVVVLWRLGRLGRSLREVVDLVEQLREWEVVLLAVYENRQGHRNGSDSPVGGSPERGMTLHTTGDGGSSEAVLRADDWRTHSI